MKEKNLKGKKIGVFVEIIRYKNCLMAGIFAIVGFLVASDINLSSILQVVLTSDILQVALASDVLQVALAFFAVFFVTGGGNTMNDYFDIDVDATSHDERPIPSGRISLKEASRFAAICLILGIVLAFLINNKWCVAIAGFNVLMLFLYDWRLKKTGLFGNITISYLVASPVIFGSLAAIDGLTLTKTLILLAVLAFLANLTREIEKDIEDIKGDRIKRETLPMKIGPEKATIVAVSFLVIAIVLSPLPLIWNTLGWGYLTVFGADLIFVASIRFAILELKDAHTIQKWIKRGMAVALLAFVLGVIL